MRLIKNGFGMPRRGALVKARGSIVEGRRPLCCKRIPCRQDALLSCPLMQRTLSSRMQPRRLLHSNCRDLSRPAFVPRRTEFHSSPANTRWKVDFYRLDSFLSRLDVAEYICTRSSVDKQMVLSSPKFENLVYLYTMTNPLCLSSK